VPPLSWHIPDLAASGVLVEVELSTVGKAAGSRKTLQTYGLVDTGAATTVIGFDVVDGLGLNPKGSGTIFGASGQSPTFRYDLRLRLPLQDVAVEPLVVVAAALPTAPTWQPFRCLLGRDVLSQACLVYLGETETVALAVKPQ
jgi:hypothetical protein